MSGAASTRPSHRLRAAQRVRRNSDFSAIREQGRRHDTGAFLLVWRARPAATTAARVGVIASRKSVGPAVQRNRAKRRLRAIFRRHQDLVPPGLDLLLTARPALLRLSYAEVEQRFCQACRRLSAASAAPASPAPPPHA